MASSTSSLLHLFLILLLCCASSNASRTGRFFSSSGSSSSSRGRRSTFFNFSGCRFGESRQGLRQMKQYLANLGYLPSSPSFSDTFDESLRAAVLAYQHFFHLNGTGELDPSTLAMMARPRCGVPDVRSKSNSSSSSLHGRNLYSFFDGKPTWPRTKSTLTYGFDQSTSTVSINKDVLRPVFSRAFGRWAEVTTFTFSEVDPSLEKPDLTIGFFVGEHGDGEPFDGPGEILAHAFAPTDGRCHFDASETWAVVPTEAEIPAEAVDLETTVMHEIGHLLGLDHSRLKGAIMYASQQPGTRKVELTRDDISGIQTLYP